MRICNLIAFAGGAVIGGAVVWMFASEKGKEFRRELKEKMDESKQQIARRFNECTNGCGVQTKEDAE